MKRYYLVDFDSIKKMNVNADNFDCKTYIQLFYIDSHHPKNIDLDCLQIFNQYAKKIEYIKVADQKHLMGKYVCGALGLLLGESKNNEHEYVIVSPKVSYDPYVQYLKDLGYQVKRINNFNPEEKPEKKKKEEVKKEPVKKEAPAPKKEKKPAKEQIIEKKEEKPVVEKKEEKPVVQEVVEAVVATPKEEVVKEEDIYTTLYNRIKKSLAKHKNSNGNRYSTKARGEIPRIVMKEIQNGNGLKEVFTKLDFKYPQTGAGIFELVRPIVLELFPDTLDYENVPDNFEEEMIANHVREVIENYIIDQNEEDIPAITYTIEDTLTPMIEDEIITIQENIQEEKKEDLEDQVALIQEVEQIQADPVQSLLNEEIDPIYHENILAILEESKLPGKKANFVYLSLSKLLGRKKAVELNRQLKEIA